MLGFVAPNPLEIDLQTTFTRQRRGLPWQVRPKFSGSGRVASATDGDQVGDDGSDECLSERRCSTADEAEQGDRPRLPIHRARRRVLAPAKTARRGAPPSDSCSWIVKNPVRKTPHRDPTRAATMERAEPVRLAGNASLRPGLVVLSTTQFPLC